MFHRDYVLIKTETRGFRMMIDVINVAFYPFITNLRDSQAEQNLTFN